MFRLYINRYILFLLQTNDLNYPLSSTSYTEILYAHLLDSDNTRLTYTHFSTKVKINTLVEITFNRPVYIQKNKVYIQIIILSVLE